MCRNITLTTPTFSRSAVHAGRTESGNGRIQTRSIHRAGCVRVGYKHQLLLQIYIIGVRNEHKTDARLSSSFSLTLLLLCCPLGCTIFVHTQCCTHTQSIGPGHCWRARLTQLLSGARVCVPAQNTRQRRI
jgi:hypothetical protein